MSDITPFLNRMNELSVRSGAHECLSLDWLFEQLLQHGRLMIMQHENGGHWTARVNVPIVGAGSTLEVTSHTQPYRQHASPQEALQHLLVNVLTMKGANK